MSSRSQRPDTFHWWIDEVGGFLVFTRDRIQIGHIANQRNDIGILGDLSSFHAELLREAQGTVLIAHRETEVNGVPGSSFLLKDKDRIKMRSVEMKYHQPIAWSRTARLEITSRQHRLPLALDGVLLLADTCMLSNRKDAHVEVPWETPVSLTWYRNQYWLRGHGALEIDGQSYPGWGPLGAGAMVKADWGRFRWENATKVKK